MTELEALPSMKVSVLIADDNQETRRSVRLMLSENPDVVVVAIARDGQEAIELAKEHNPDLVILDINMPELDGLAAFGEIKQRHPETGCIIISVERESGRIESALALGVQEYLLKPFTVEELNEAVSRAAVPVMERRRKQAEAERLYRESEAYLKPLAEEYAKSRRTDDEALGVFEQLAKNPACDMRWLQTLAMLYVIRQEWAKLAGLAERLRTLTGKDM